MRIAFRMQKKSRITRRDSCKDTGRFWVLDWKRSGMEDPRTLPMEKGTPQPKNGTTIQGNRSSRVHSIASVL